MAAEAGFEWRMEDRFGLDRDADGRIDRWHDERVVYQVRRRNRLGSRRFR